MNLKKQLVEHPHGTLGDDHCRWLETDTPEVLLWEQQQNSVTDDHLGGWHGREALRQAIYRGISYNETDHPFGSSLPVFCNNKVFYTGRLKEEQHTVLFAMNQTSGVQEILVNPNDMGEDSDLDWFYPSPDGEYVAYGISRHGDEQSVLYIIETSTGTILPERIPFTSFCRISWLPDSSGFYYSGGIASDLENAEKWVFFHQLGCGIASEAEEVRLFDPYVSPQVSPCGRYLTVNRSWEKPCTAFYKERMSKAGWKPFLSDLEEETYGHFYNSCYYVLTTNGADRGRIVSIPMETADDRNTWKEIVPESQAVLQQFAIVDEHIIISELYNAYSRLRIISIEKRDEKLVELPGFGLIEIPGAPDSSPFSVNEKNVYFCYTTFLEPSRVYKYDLESGLLEAVGQENNLDLSHLTVEEVFYPSMDGTEVPMYLIYKKSTDFSCSHNVLLHGYGGWNLNIAPSYIGEGRTCVLPFVESGGIYAFACLRGGCELGRSWWQNGRREKKQNTFNDLYAAAEYLISKGLTTPRQLAAMGASNGGLLTAVAVTQRPDLFQAVVSEVPLTDMIRALQDPYLSSYKVEYGDPDELEMYDILMSYSPVHNVANETAYPATFILSGKNDIRCQAWNGRKFAALLQLATSSNNPVLLKIAEGGHGPGISLTAEVERRLDVLCFIMKYLGMEVAEV